MCRITPGTTTFWKQSGGCYVRGMLICLPCLSILSCPLELCLRSEIFLEGLTVVLDLPLFGSKRFALLKNVFLEVNGFEESDSQAYFIRSTVKSKISQGNCQANSPYSNFKV